MNPSQENVNRKQNSLCLSLSTNMHFYLKLDTRDGTPDFTYISLSSSDEVSGKV